MSMLYLIDTTALQRCQVLRVLGYNDAAHIEVKKWKRYEYFARVRKVWTVMRKRSKMRVNRSMLKTLKKEVSLYDRPPSIILRTQKEDK